MTKKRSPKTDAAAKDAALFDAAMRGVAPLPAAKKADPAPVPAAQAVSKPEPAAKSAPKPAKITPGPASGLKSRPAAPAVNKGIDKRTNQRLKRGQMKIDGRLDLHGQYQADAHRELHGFVRASHANGRSCLLVITGKGAPKAGDEDGIMPNRDRGILRRNVPRWLAEAPVRDMVLSIETARPQHGGDGAFYVLLRRKR
jgi:DNA-nicking Smr family endonuclease